MAATQMTSTSGRALRRDALANQERVLAAAVTTLLRDGRQASMATIAAAAGVGVGTLYRRYPNREALLSALTERSFQKVLAVAEDAADQQGTAMAALDRFLDRTIEHRDQLVLPLHGGPTALSSAAADTRARVHATLEGVLERGREDGSVRAGITASDVIAFGAMLAQPLSGTPDWAHTARRQKMIFLAGVAGPHGALPSDTPATAHEPEQRRRP